MTNAFVSLGAKIGKLCGTGKGKGTKMRKEKIYRSLLGNMDDFYYLCRAVLSTASGTDRAV